MAANTQQTSSITGSFLAALALLLGCIVIFGWYTHNTTLIQVLPYFVPMQYNTALGFILISAGLLTKNFNYSIASKLFGTAALILGVLTLSEYIFNINLGIDQLFMQHYITTETSHPGRMAPNTALCFTLAGATLMWQWVRQPIEQKLFICILLSLIVFTLGIIALFGYLSDLSALYRWGALTNMAVHTSIGFAIWSLASIFIHAKNIHKQQNLTRTIYPLIGFFSSMIIFAILWQIVIFNESQQVSRVINHVKNEIPQEISALIKEQNAAIERMNSRWKINKDTPNKWQHDAQTYIHDFSSIEGIIWAKPNHAEDQLQARFNKENPHKRYLIDHVASLFSRSNHLTSQHDRPQALPPKLFNHESYIAVSYPTNDHQGTHIIVIYDLKNLIQDALSQVAFRHYNLMLSYHNTELFSLSNNQSGSAILSSPWARDFTIKFYGRNLQASIWPTPTLLEEYRTWTATIILLTGILFSALISIFMRTRLVLKQQRQLLNQSNQELESFSYSISHDLRAPLRHMMGFVDLLEKNKSLSVDDTGKRHLKIISKSAVKMGNLIDDLLQLSRATRREINVTEFPLNPLIHEVIDELSYECETRNISWKINKLPKIHADRSFFKLVIQNLISNAIKFTRECATAEISIQHDESSEHHKIIISDNGIGFEQKYQDKLFGVFQRLHRDDEYEGTGIGLANVDRIMRKHHGYVIAEGAVNKGATFTIYIPKR